MIASHKLSTCSFAAFTAFFCAFGTSAIAQSEPQLGKASISQVVSAMTLEEKAALLVGVNNNSGGAPVVIGGVGTASPRDKVAGAAGRTFAVPRLGIPSLTLADGPAGLRIQPTRSGDTNTYYATGFPVASLAASTWDKQAVARIGAAMGEEVREYGVDILLAPALNIHRNPLGGRNFEYYSEDPLIAGSMAAAFVNGVQSQGVGTSIKHFAANNAEFNRMKLNTIVTERALREIYLPGFEIAVKESAPWTVMSSYNLINGTYTSQSRDLLSTALRTEWGFKGLVMTDWSGGSDPVEQMNAENDVLMPGRPNQVQAIVQAVKDGKISQQQLDANVARTLEIVCKSPAFKNYPFSNHPDLKAHARVAREVAAEGMVLLKNEKNTLPLKSNRSIALFGNASYDLIAGGTGSGDVNKAYVVSLDQGLANSGVAIDAGLKKLYADYLKEKKSARGGRGGAFGRSASVAEMSVDDAAVKALALSADSAIFTLGRSSGEFSDRKLTNDYLLSDGELALMNSIAQAFHAAGKKFIVVMNVGGVTDTMSWRDKADAILLAWQPGQEGGDAIADVLSGKVNPSGKLASTFPRKYEDVPSAKSFPGKVLSSAAGQPGNAMSSAPSEVTYEEDIYVGYRYYSTFGVDPAYEFGCGLSYTQFKFSGIKADSSKLTGPVNVSCTIKNTGKAAGKEVAQVYISGPKGQFNRPAVELKAFGKTKLLAPGESERLSFKLAEADFASYDPAVSAWVVEPGTYKICVGASSKDIKSTANIVVPHRIVVEQDHRILTPKAEFSTLTAPVKK